jgi:hypothetical protein
VVLGKVDDFLVRKYHMHTLVLAGETPFAYLDDELVNWGMACIRKGLTPFGWSVHSVSSFFMADIVPNIHGEVDWAMAARGIKRGETMNGLKVSDKVHGCMNVCLFQDDMLQSENDFVVHWDFVGEVSHGT